MDNAVSLACGNGFALVPGSGQWTQTVHNLIAQSIDPVSAVLVVQRVQERWPDLDMLTVAETLRDLEQVLMEVQAIGEAAMFYLELPPALAVLREEALYVAGLPWGRAAYRVSMYELDATGQWVYMPRQWQLVEVLDLVEQDICPTDRRTAVTLPLAYRVGFSVGWLSGLAVVQPDEARKGLVILAGLVVPLLVVPTVPGGNRASRRAAARATTLPAPRKQKGGVKHG